MKSIKKSFQLVRECQLRVTLQLIINWRLYRPLLGKAELELELAAWGGVTSVYLEGLKEQRNPKSRSWGEVTPRNSLHWQQTLPLPRRFSLLQVRFLRDFCPSTLPGNPQRRRQLHPALRPKLQFEPEFKSNAELKLAALSCDRKPGLFCIFTNLSADGLQICAQLWVYLLSFRSVITGARWANWEV